MLNCCCTHRERADAQEEELLLVNPAGTPGTVSMHACIPEVLRWNLAGCSGACSSYLSQSISCGVRLPMAGRCCVLGNRPCTSTIPIPSQSSFTSTQQSRMRIKRKWHSEPMRANVPGSVWEAYCSSVGPRSCIGCSPRTSIHLSPCSATSLLFRKAGGQHGGGS